MLKIKSILPMVKPNTVDSGNQSNPEIAHPKKVL